MGNCLGLRDDPDGHALPIVREEAPPNVDRVASRPPPYQADPGPMYHPDPHVSRLAHQLTEDEQVKIAKRIGLIQHLPVLAFDESKKQRIRECPICMIDFETGDKLRYLPCVHMYHMECIDDWLMRSPICPSCREPVEAGMLTSFSAQA